MGLVHSYFVGRNMSVESTLVGWMTSEVPKQPSYYFNGVRTSWRDTTFSRSRRHDNPSHHPVVADTSLYQANWGRIN
ncbi:hypothetical protein E2C01_002560 [Portunus trituberculatus]|uniref:Uncharacterized protein n=1 Tax=Portunus trituberculatus TaxID=210409 RepID=A0A5B7CMC8_PORTR|nr:hypothetical protein [Portunus trituberculatus]